MTQTQIQYVVELLMNKDVVLERGLSNESSAPVLISSRYFWRSCTVSIGNGELRELSEGIRGIWELSVRLGAT